MPASPSSRNLPTTPARSALMRRVARRDTAPELAVRRWLFAQGLRFRLHGAGLPGRPDIVLARRHTVVFVHGCFWHGHHCKHGRVQARTNSAYWTAKIADNRARDQRQRKALRALGWQVEVLWECESARPDKLDRLARRLLAR